MQGTLSRIVAGTTIAAIAAFAFVAVQGPGPAVAAPGVPEAPTVIYAEDFENAPDTGSPQLLTAYTSTSPQYPGGTYTASAGWVSNASCNGFILSSGNTYPPGACANNAGSFNTLRTLAPVLGTIGGTPAAANSVVAAYTANNPGANQIQFATVSPIALPTPSRYITFSVDAAATNCYTTAPQLQFYVRNADGTETALGGVINPCNTADVRTTYVNGFTRGGHYPANGSFIATGDAVGIVMRNANGSGGGNDGAFDNIQILDVTPQLDKAFGTPNPVTGAASLTFTITNTSELGAKLGWTGTDTLAPGLVVASPANASTTCTNGSVTAAAGSATIALAGDLAAGQASCTFTVDVVPATPTAQGAPAQVFQNCASNMSGITGLNPPTSCATGTFPPVAQLRVVKSTTATGASREGDVVGYSIVVTNTGGSDYTAAVPATMSDDLTAVLDDATYNNDATATGPGAAPTLSWSGPLAAGASVTITYTMTLTLAGDLDLRNTATVPPAQARTPADATSTVDVPIAAAPSIDLVKSADPMDAADYTVGQTITYSFVVTNTGNVSLSNPTVTEDSFDGAGALSAPSCPATPTLMPGAQMTCTATYTLVQADIDASSITNTATAHGTPASGVTVDSPQRSVTVPGVQSPSVSIDKTAGPGGFTTAGQVVTYSFLLTNTGNVTLQDATVDEGAFSGTGALSPVTCPASAATMLPGATVTCTATYTLTQADVDAGTVTNAATATAVPPAGGTVDSDPDEATVTIAPAPALGLVKTAGPAGLTRAGQVVDYGFVITNLGNVTLTGIGVTEVAFSGTGALSAVACPAGAASLAPTQSVTCTATYTLTQADVDAGVVANTAIAEGDPPLGGAVSSPQGDAVVPIAPVAALEVVKSVSSSTAAVGQQVIYNFLVTNTGESTVSAVAITEVEFTGGGTLAAVDCPATTLPPAAVMTCTAAYTTTGADLARGAVDNTAVVTGADPFGTVVESPESSARLRVVSSLAVTGAALAGASLALVATALLATGALMLLLRRRRAVA